LGWFTPFSPKKGPNIFHFTGSPVGPNGPPSSDLDLLVKKPKWAFFQRFPLPTAGGCPPFFLVSVRFFQETHFLQGQTSKQLLGGFLPNKLYRPPHFPRVGPPLSQTRFPERWTCSIKPFGQSFHSFFWYSPRFLFGKQGKALPIVFLFVRFPFLTQWFLGWVGKNLLPSARG